MHHYCALETAKRVVSLNHPNTHNHCRIFCCLRTCRYTVSTHCFTKQHQGWRAAGRVLKLCGRIRRRIKARDTSKTVIVRRMQMTEGETGSCWNRSPGKAILKHWEEEWEDCRKAKGYLRTDAEPDGLKKPALGDRLEVKRVHLRGRRKPTISSRPAPVSSYCSNLMFRRSPLLIRTMQSFSWNRPCCSAFPPFSRRLTNKPRVLKVQRFMSRRCNPTVSDTSNTLLHLFHQTVTFFLFSLKSRFHSGMAVQKWGHLCLTAACASSPCTPRGHVICFIPLPMRLLRAREGSQPIRGL